jgi:hypothetical protein
MGGVEMSKEDWDNILGDCDANNDGTVKPMAG